MLLIMITVIALLSLDAIIIVIFISCIVLITHLQKERAHGKEPTRVRYRPMDRALRTPVQHLLDVAKKMLPI